MGEQIRTLTVTRIYVCERDSKNLLEFDLAADRIHRRQVNMDAHF